MKVALLVAFTAAAASATHQGYNPVGFYPSEFRGEPFSYRYGMKPYYEPGLGYEGIQYKSAILPGMYSFEVPEYVLKSYLPEIIYKHYVPVSSGYFRSSFVPENVLKTYLPKDLYQFYVPHVQVPTPILKSYLPETVYRTYMPFDDQIQQKFSQVPEAVVKTYLPKEVYGTYIPTQIQIGEGKGHQVEHGAFKSILPTTVALDDRMTLGAGYNGLGHGLRGNQFRNMYGGLEEGLPLHRAIHVGNEFGFGLPLVDAPIVQIPIIQ